MKFKQLRFANRYGHKLAARIDLPDDGAPHAYAIFAHCFTCTKNLKAVAAINQALTQDGIAVLRFDFTGLGQSEGDFADTNFTTNVSDIVDAAEFLADQYEAPRMLIGHSLGGAAVLQAAVDVPSARAVVAIAAPSRPDHILKHFSDATEEIEARGEAEVHLAGRPFRIKKQFLENLGADRMTDTIKGLNRALLVLHAPLDNIVGIGNAGEIFQTAKHPKSFVSLDSADHLLTDPDDARYAGDVIAVWGRRYIAKYGGSGGTRSK